MSENENEILDETVEVEEVEKEEIVLDLLNPMVIKLESQNELHSRVSIEPFERGFGYTLGNAIRRDCSRVYRVMRLQKLKLTVFYTSIRPLKAFKRTSLRSY